jgi:ubiquinone/menaquinone biosynthesis C-methylase UbiE
MKFVKIDPPGTFCTREALRDALADRGGQTFLDVGCGGGDFSRLLCEAGLTGVGVDFSERAVAIAGKTLAPYIAEGKYRLHLGDVHDLPPNFAKVDLAISYMVMEHVEDDKGFLETIARFVKPGGNLIIAVPGRRDCWSLEDETVGHLRRYDRGDLDAVLRKANLEAVSVWSVGVPTINMLFNISLKMVARSAAETSKMGLSQREQTETSGIREIPWKTVFPSWVHVILNRVTLYPLFVIQRWFYRTNLGVVMMGMGRVQ